LTAHTATIDSSFNSPSLQSLADSTTSGDNDPLDDNHDSMIKNDTDIQKDHFALPQHERLSCIAWNVIDSRNAIQNSLRQLIRQIR
jgi:hypothetical protein